VTSDAISADSKSLREHIELLECPASVPGPGLYTLNARLQATLNDRLIAKLMPKV